MLSYTFQETVLFMVVGSIWNAAWPDLADLGQPSFQQSIVYELFWYLFHLMCFWKHRENALISFTAFVTYFVQVTSAKNSYTGFSLIAIHDYFFLLLLERPKCLKQEHNKYQMTNLRQWDTHLRYQLYRQTIICSIILETCWIRQIHCPLFAISFGSLKKKSCKAVISKPQSSVAVWCMSYINQCCWLRVSK